MLWLCSMGMVHCALVPHALYGTRSTPLDIKMEAVTISAREAPLFLHGITYISNYSYYCHYHFYYHAMYMILSSYWSQIHYPPSWELIIKLFWNDSYCIYMLFPTIPYFIFFLRRHDLSFLDVLHQPNATAALFIQSRSPTDMRQHRLITTTFLHFN